MKRELYKIHLVILLVITACTSTAIFNQRAYEQNISIKVESIALMNKADQPYSNFIEEIEKLKLDIEKAYEYAKGLPNNDETVAQWEIIKDPERNSIIGFLKRWEEENTLNRAFIDNSIKLISEHLDQVIELESGKRK